MNEGTMSRREQDELEEQILDAVDRWVEREVRPIAREYDQADRYPDALVDQMKDWACSAPPSTRATADWVSGRQPMPSWSPGFVRSGWRRPGSSTPT